MRYGKSKLDMLYPIMRSGSISSIKSRHFCNRCSSDLNDRTWDPTICEQVLRAKTLRMNGFDSPAKNPGWLVSENTEVLTLSSYHVCNLNNRIDWCIRENTFATCTLNIETENSQRRNLRPICFWGMRNESVVSVEKNDEEELTKQANSPKG